MSRYGYLCMPVDWSDINDIPITITTRCLKCGRIETVKTIRESLGEDYTDNGDGTYNPPVCMCEYQEEQC